MDSNQPSKELNEKLSKKLEEINGGRVFGDVCPCCDKKIDETTAFGDEQSGLKTFQIFPGCGHLICKVCSEEWLNRNRICPSCRLACTRVISVYEQKDGKLAGRDHILGSSGSGGRNISRVINDVSFGRVINGANQRSTGRQGFSSRNTIMPVMFERPTPACVEFTDEQTQLHQELNGMGSSASSVEPASVESASVEPASVESASVGPKPGCYRVRFCRRRNKITVKLERTDLINDNRRKAKDYFFLFDVSGSMGQFIVQLRLKIQEVLDSMKEFHRVCIILFSSGVSYFCQLSTRNHITHSVDEIYADGCTYTSVGVQFLIDTIKQAQPSFLPNAELIVKIFSDGEANAGYGPTKEQIDELIGMRNIDFEIAVIGNGARIKMFLDLLSEKDQQCINAHTTPATINCNTGVTVAQDIAFIVNGQRYGYDGTLKDGSSIIKYINISDNEAASSASVEADGDSVSCEFVDDTGNLVMVEATVDDSLAILEDQTENASVILRKAEHIYDVFSSSQWVEQDKLNAIAKINELREGATVETLGPYRADILDNLARTIASIERPEDVAAENSRVASNRQQSGRIMSQTSP
jgi:hypothetical protein